MEMSLNNIPSGKIPYIISAGEPSGDLLAGDLAVALRERLPDHEPYGIVGSHMEQAGVNELAHIRELTVMGFTEIIKHLPRIKRLENELVAKIEKLRPAFAVLVDYPGFHLHLAARLKALGIKVFMYVAPQMWAWGEYRVARLRKVTDVVLGIVPFERQFFMERGVNYHYVGTPQVDRALRVKNAASVDFGLGPHEGTVRFGFFPGSRPSEIQRIVPLFPALKKAIEAKVPEARFALSLAPNLTVDLLEGLVPEDLLPFAACKEALTQGDTYHNHKSRLSIVRGQSLALMAQMDAACVTSGTATLECALVGTPLSVLYVASPLTYWLGRHLVKLPHISLVNLVAGEELVKEFVQEIDPGAVAEEQISMATKGAQREKMLARLSSLHGLVQGQPGIGAANIIIKEISKA
jgi:lipid-A-disaccharide synthase